MSKIGGKTNEDGQGMVSVGDIMSQLSHPVAYQLGDT